MPDASDPPGLIPRLRAAVERSFIVEVVRRFFELELLDRCLAIAAQAFVALLPLEIVLVTTILADGPVAITNAIGDRFGLDSIARQAIRALFAADTTQASISWLAVVISVLTAFALSRRLSRVYASIFEVPSLRRAQSWRGIVWIGLQIALLFSSSLLRDLRRDNGVTMFLLGTAGLLLLWWAADLAALRLLVPTVALRLAVASAVVASLGRLGVSAWSALYMPHALSEQAAQYGPIGVTFSIFTYLLAGALVYTIAPLLVVTWTRRRQSPEKSPAAGV